MNQPPFDTVGEAPVEARIVAWVLGEASAFETAELERLCEESPELLIFHRRMLALHGLLTEAESAAADSAWKLSPTKRGALDEILGQEKVIPLDSQKELRVRRAGKRAFFAVAACLVLAVVVLQLVHPIWIRQTIIAPEKKVDFMPAGGEEGSFGAGGVAMQHSVPARGENVGEMRSSGTFKVDSGTVASSREPGLQQAARQSQLAKQAPKPRVIPPAALEVADRDAIPGSEALPSVALNGSTSGGLGGGSGIGTGQAFSDAPANPSAPAEPAPVVSSSRAGGGAFRGDGAMAGKKAAGERFEARLSDSLDGESAEATVDKQLKLEGASRLTLNGKSRSLEDAKDNSGVAKNDAPVGDVASEVGDKSEYLYRGRDLAAKGEPTDGADFTAARQIGSVRSGNDVLLTNGMRSGDQSINRNSIDAVLNNPNRREAERGRKVDEGKAMADAKPPVLSGKESSVSQGPLGGSITVNGKLSSVGGEWSGLAKDELDSGADAPIRSNLALTDEHTQNVDKVRRALYAAEGNLNLGKYDDSKKAYEEVLRTDPYNSAARRGLEKIATAKSDYYRAAYDHTRAELLAQVDAAWELKVPAEGKDADFKGSVNYGSPIADQERQDEGAVADPFADADVAQEKQLAHRGATPAKPAQQNLVELIEEIPASENPYSTFSLNISDASFQMAKAALAKGERPDPESIKPEQFYNAVDYGDPAPTSNEPVAATIEQSAHPFIPGRNLVRVALRTGSVGRSAAQPLRLTLLVDQSGSMVREDRRASMEHALAQLGVLLTKNDLVSVVGFSRTPHLLADGMTGDQAMKLGGIVNQTASEGGTNLEEALKLGRQMAERHQLAGAQNRIVLFTDGAANLGDADPARLAEQVKALRQKGISFDIAGIGADGLNDKLLGEMARNGNGRYYVVGSEKNDSFARQLAGAFRPAAENVKVQVIFNPQRVGKYQLIGFEKDRLKTEDFRNDAVDAAELAAEEAGVAIYQVEPLAGGSGELGEVSVRFRDAAGGQMVERSWTIPHDARATAFDRSTPSMQLAGLSLFAAEKLKGGPLADAIDFQQLSGSSAFVKQFYGNSPRVSDMLRVIDALK